MPTKSAKSEHVEMLRARLALWNAELEELRARAGGRADLERAVAELVRLRDAAAEQTKAIESAGSGWERLISGVEKEFEALGDAFGRTRSRFGE